LVPREKKMAHFWARREARFAICPFFLRIFFRPGLFFGRLEQPKRPPNAPGLASVPAAVLWQHYFHHRPPTVPPARRSQEALVHWCGLVHMHSPPTRRGSCFMPRGTARAHLATDAAILPTPWPLPSIEPRQTCMGDTVPISFSVVPGEPSD
jgi:hypothetical protein